MTLPRGVVRAIALLQASVLPLGCWTVCKETDEWQTVYSIDVERDQQGRLIATRGSTQTFANCEDLCNDQPGLIEFKRCGVAVATIDASTPSREKVSVACDGVWASCHAVPSFGSGRIPEGYAARVSATYLGECARLESAAAVAFDRLARELTEHGAPAHLVAEAWRAAQDERRHAELMGVVAETFGEVPLPYEAPPLPTRPLLAVAIENAREGVVHETFGAVLNAHQAERAEGELLRHVYTTIADDELRHARLSIEVHRWLLTQLPGNDRARVIAEVETAIGGVHTQLASTSSRDAYLGLPTKDEARRILETLSESVWSACA